MNAAISSKTFSATTHAGRINFKSSSDFNFIPATVFVKSLNCDFSNRPAFSDSTIQRFNNSTVSEPSAQLAFFQEAVVMAHHQMRFDLAHRVQQNTDRDQNTRAAEETRD